MPFGSNFFSSFNIHIGRLFEKIRTFQKSFFIYKKVYFIADSISYATNQKQVITFFIKTGSGRR